MTDLKLKPFVNKENNHIVAFDTLEIRFAQLSDEEEIKAALGLMLKELRGPNTVPEINGFEKAFRTIITDSSKGFLMIAIYQQKLVGFLGASFHTSIHTGGLYASLEELWTDPKQRYLFAGIYLIRIAENYIKSLGIRIIDLGSAGFSNKHYKNLCNFYQKLGYKDIGPRFKKILED